MRLIDADELKKKIRHWNYNVTTSAPTFDFVTDGDIDECSTVDVLDKIRAEIQKVLDAERDFTSENAKAQAIALSWCLDIIDKYTKGDKE